MRCRRGLPLRGRLRCEPSGARNECRILGNTSIGVAQLPVGLKLFSSFQHSGSAAAEEVRSAGPLSLCEPVQAVDEFVIELDENLTASHEHMVTHMVRISATSTTTARPRGRPALPEATFGAGSRPWTPSTILTEGVGGVAEDVQAHPSDRKIGRRAGASAAVTAGSDLPRDDVGQLHSRRSVRLPLPVVEGSATVLGLTVPGSRQGAGSGQARIGVRGRWSCGT